jgi:competence protein ComEC
MTGSGVLFSPSHDSEIPRPDEVWWDFWRAPLVPVAWSATVGLMLSRYLHVPTFLFWSAALGGMMTWWLLRQNPNWRRLPPWGLWITSAALAGIYHHHYRETYPADDISTFATDSPQPRRIRAWVLQEPDYHPAQVSSLMNIQPLPTTRLLVRISSLETSAGWIPASGRVLVTVEGHLEAIHAGDAVEIFGQLSLPPLPDNPGQSNWRSLLRDERITAILRVRHSPATVTRWEAGRWQSWRGVLGYLQQNGEARLRRLLSEHSAGLAVALLLGETSALEREHWEAYVRTGVVHVLAISGFHLTVLTGWVWWLMRASGWSSRRASILVAGLVLFYTWLTGARPATVRAAAMVCAWCLACSLRRPPWPANILALAWLIVILVKPTDPFTLGCQLSFLSVFVLIWAGGRWLLPRSRTPLERIRDAGRGRFSRAWRWLVQKVGHLYFLSLLITVALAPQLMYWKNVLTPASILLGPPVMLTSSLAIMAGFVTLATAPLGNWAAYLPAQLTDLTLGITAWMVQQVDSWSQSVAYAPAPALIWLLGYYLILTVVVLAPLRRVINHLAALVVWTLLGLIVAMQPRTSDELRVTFLAVGHGGCVVLETPDGRTLLYDVGSMSGPRIVSSIVAPYLWHRGIRRIDELFLSHADMDHFNGLPSLLSLFAVGRISWTPTFADRTTAGVQTVLDAVQRAGIPTRVISAGEGFSAGDVRLHVLHPPQQGPIGTENTRSLTLLVQYAQQSLLLTGDLEGIGQEMVQRQPIPPVAVLMAPHHGGKTANAAGRNTFGESLPSPLAQWARPRLVISCQRTNPIEHLRAAYPNAVIWDTGRCGAVTVRIHQSGVTAEAFRTGEKIVVARPPLPSVRKTATPIR